MLSGNSERWERGQSGFFKLRFGFGGATVERGVAGNRWYWRAWANGNGSEIGVTDSATWGRWMAERALERLLGIAEK